MAEAVGAAVGEPIHPLFDVGYYRHRHGLTTLDDRAVHEHYRSRGRAAGLDPNAFFSVSWYVGRNADVLRLGLDPLDHYLHHGARLGRDPGPMFSSWGYWLLHADVLAAGHNPLVHYLRHGRGEGRAAPSAAMLQTCLRDFTLAAHAAGTVEAVGTAEARHEPASRDEEPDAAPRGAGDAAGRIAPFAPCRRRAAKPGDAAAEHVIRRRSPLLIRGLAAVFAYDLAASFHGVRLLGTLPASVEGPLVLVTNHPSWWDAQLYHWLAVTLFPGRRGFAPMNTVQLSRYAILTRLGAFPTRPGGHAGASAFLDTAERLLREPDALLVVASEGRYRDVRCRPLRVMPGVAHLARRVPEATFVPMAIEYAFWSARRPNLLLHFGTPVAASTLVGLTTPQVTARFNAGLTDAMSTLAEAAQTRQPALFRELLRGREGYGAIYALWRGARAALRRVARWVSAGVDRAATARRGAVPTGVGDPS